MLSPKAFQCCSWCGVAFAKRRWPRTCAACKKTTTRNALPVVVLIVPVASGVLCIRRRGAKPQEGALVLPSRPVGHDESWQTAGARELFEEAQVKTDPARIRGIDVISGPDSTILIFGETKPLTKASLPPFTPTRETAERVVVKGPTPLGVPLHQQVLAAWFARRPPSR